MPTFQRCDTSVKEMANAILCEFESHRPLLDARVNIDLVFALCDRDDEGKSKGCALKWNGIPALGLARKLSLKDRAMGRGDCEISLDGDWWQEATEAERRALLDHELHHISIKLDERGLVTDDLGRPVVVLRKHDIQIGWFDIIAKRHGRASEEVRQAKLIMEDHGQFYWPDIAPPRLQGLAEALVGEVGIEGAKLVVNLAQHKKKVGAR